MPSYTGSHQQTNASSVLQVTKLCGFMDLWIYKYSVFKPVQALCSLTSIPDVSTLEYVFVFQIRIQYVSVFANVAM